MRIESLLFKIVVVAVIILVAYFFFRPTDSGQHRFFEDQSYHFQTLRALNDIPFDGADIQEVLQTIRKIKSGDSHGWYSAWTETGKKSLKMAETVRDTKSRGRAYLRAHNYFRTAEFFLPPDDPKRGDSWKDNTSAFYKGLDILGITYERIRIPFGKNHLNAIYYPGPIGFNERPLIVFFGGYDSTLEELYFTLVADAWQHGYSVLTFEGPGQGSVLREQGLVFTHEWEIPTKAVIDRFLESHRRPRKIVLVGMSMGGYLAPRAAAFDDRIDGVVAFDVLFDMGAVAKRYVPPVSFWLKDHGLNSVLMSIVKIKSFFSPGFAWATANGEWTLGTKHPLDTVKEFEKYNLSGIAKRIKSHVLILAGEEDHFIPVEQVSQFQTELTGAESVTTKIYDRNSGGAEHCQMGAIQLWHADFFDWMREKFGSENDRFGGK
ncbi:alpha/beta hydrolase family protein [Leptospira broomii serovar Hurstbridge str. 5399]|uniref:Alpha/beta hydrolase family protein n=1 Tax=Leptospira broomii serovar Hurstbridge str. 5399 TaxID=1049789 RepID=T0GKG0_9LEPT|nr:alpha/beta fold hydrolase [Leptospira broomii]EQA45873.1 alpha/beta hydrolase family protein [Leptospira broomii serovar Hurstbridge str. 5399]